MSSSSLTSKDRDRKERREKHRDSSSRKEKKEHKHNKKGHKSKKDGGEQLRTTSLLDEYTLGEQIGGIAQGGEFWTTIKAGTSKATGQSVLVKNVRRPEKLDVELRKEILKAKTLSHPNLVKLIDAYEDNEYFYLVTEHFPQKIAQKALPEAEVKDIVRQTVAALVYLHSQGLLSSWIELKPEKFLRDGNTLKLDDIGINQAIYPTEDKLRSLGSASKSLYVAPEIILSSEEVAPVADVWSLGVLIYYFLSGTAPFTALSEPALFKKILGGEYSLSGEVWDTVSAAGKDLLKKLLVSDPSKRLTLDQLKEEAWLK